MLLVQRVESVCHDGSRHDHQQMACLPFDLTASTEDVEAAVHRAHSIAASWNTAVPGITHLVLNAGQAV